MEDKNPAQPAAERTEVAEPCQRYSGWLGWRTPIFYGLLVGVASFATAAFFYAIGAWAWVAAGLLTGSTIAWVAVYREGRWPFARRRQKMITRITESLPVMIFQCRMLAEDRWVLTYSNNAIRWIYELEYRDVKGDCSPLLDLVHPEDREQVKKSFLESALHLTPWVSEHRVLLPRQGLRWRFIHARVERLLDGTTMWNGFVMDNTSQKEAQENLLLAGQREAEALRATHEAEQKKLNLLTRLNERLHREATHDHLTGVYLRRYFDRQYEGIFEEARGSAITVILCDIDRFKNYNDSLGHLAGDQALSTVARTLSEHINRQDQILARYGGEEFVAVLPGLGSERAAVLAEILRHSIETLGLPAPDGGVVTISVGAASTDIMPRDLTAKKLLQAADEMLYAAKAAGRNRVRLYHAEGRSIVPELH